MSQLSILLLLFLNVRGSIGERPTSPSSERSDNNADALLLEERVAEHVYRDCYPGQSQGPGYVSFDECDPPGSFYCAYDDANCTTNACLGANAHVGCLCRNCSLIAPKPIHNFTCACLPVDCECSK